MFSKQFEVIFYKYFVFPVYRFTELMKQTSNNSEHQLMYAKSLWEDKSSLQNNLQTCHTALLKVRLPYSTA